MVKPDPQGQLSAPQPTFFCPNCGHQMTKCFGYNEVTEEMILKRLWCRNNNCKHDEAPIGRERRYKL